MDKKKTKKNRVVTEEYLDARGYVTEEYLDAKLDAKGYVTEEYLDAKLDAKFDEKLADYPTKAYLHYHLDKLRDDLLEQMYTKADHAKFMEWMDEAMKELREARNERTLAAYRFADLDDRVADHEKRIGALGWSKINVNLLG